MPVPIISITDPQERQVYSELFYNLEQTTKRHPSALPSSAAVTSFLEQSGLSKPTLAHIWQLVNPAASATFDQNQFYALLRLVALAQSGQEPKFASVNGARLPIPRFLGYEKYTGHTLPQPFAGHPSAAGPPPQQGAQGAQVTRPWSGGEEQGWCDMFHALTANATLRVADAMPLFHTSGLPQPIIDKIWTLCDLDGDAALTFSEFCVAMHLLSAFLHRRIVDLPDHLPPHLLSLARPPAAHDAPALYHAKATSSGPPRSASPATSLSPKGTSSGGRTVREGAASNQKDMAAVLEMLQAYHAQLASFANPLQRDMAAQRAALATWKEALSIEEQKQALLQTIQQEYKRIHAI